MGGQKQLHVSELLKIDNGTDGRPRAPNSYLEPSRFCLCKLCLFLVSLFPSQPPPQLPLARVAMPRSARRLLGACLPSYDCSGLWLWRE
jgi:hypothetical protein